MLDSLWMGLSDVAIDQVGLVGVGHVAKGTFVAQVVRVTAGCHSNAVHGPSGERRKWVIMRN